MITDAIINRNERNFLQVGRDTWKELRPPSGQQDDDKYDEYHCSERRSYRRLGRTLINDVDR